MLPADVGSEGILEQWSFLAELGVGVKNDLDFRLEILGWLRKSNPDAGTTYREALHVLNQGDDYILMMLEGLSRRLRPWWAFWR